MPSHSKSGRCYYRPQKNVVITKYLFVTSPYFRLLFLPKIIDVALLVTYAQSMGLIMPQLANAIDL